MNARDEQLSEWVKQLPLHLGDGTVEKVEITPFNDRACQVLMFHTAMKYLEKTCFTAASTGAPKFTKIVIMVIDKVENCTISVEYADGSRGDFIVNLHVLG